MPECMRPKCIKPRLIAGSIGQKIEWKVKLIQYVKTSCQATGRDWRKMLPVLRLHRWHVLCFMSFLFIRARAWTVSKSPYVLQALVLQHDTLESCKKNLPQFLTASISCWLACSYANLASWKMSVKDNRRKALQDMKIRKAQKRVNVLYMGIGQGVRRTS